MTLWEVWHCCTVEGILPTFLGARLPPRSLGERRWGPREGAGRVGSRTEDETFTDRLTVLSDKILDL